jgi:uncharacterized membrane protein
MTPAEKDWAHRSYIASLLLKAGIGTAQLAGGIGLWLVPGDRISAYVASLARLKLVEDPKDILAQWVARTAAMTPFDTGNFYMLYLGIHGLLNLCLVVALMARRRWAYPMAIAALVFFVIYQLYEYSMGKGLMMLALSALDLAVIWLILGEWRVQRMGWAKTIKGR